MMQVPRRMDVNLYLCVQDTWKHFSPEELFACILAAGIHDMGHPGKIISHDFRILSC